MHVLERKEDKTCDRYSSSAADYKHRSFKGNWRSSFQYCVAAFCVRLDNCNHLGYSLNATDGKEREVHFTEELDKKSSSNVCVTAMKCRQTWYDDLILCWSRQAMVAGVPHLPPRSKVPSNTAETQTEEMPSAYACRLSCWREVDLNNEYWKLSSALLNEKIYIYTTFTSI